MSIQQKGLAAIAAILIALMTGIPAACLIAKYIVTQPTPPAIGNKT
jgi:TRAP-type C4-dicarboxylate transport system permease small subunit